MMRSSSINHLLKYTSVLSGNFTRELSGNGFYKTLLRTSSILSSPHSFHSPRQHKKTCVLLTANEPMLQSLVKSQRYATTVANVSEPGLVRRFVKKMGWLDHSRSKLRRSGFLLYEGIGEKVNAMEFFEVCELPDTFYSWFLVTELQVWMLMVRLMAEGEEGRYTRNAVSEALWEDVEMRAKKLGDSSPTARNEQIQEIVASFQTALFTYDEGLQGDDKALASALWRRLFSKSCDDPERLECCVHYVRRQIALLDSLPRRTFLLDCKVEWVPLLERDT